jgi:oligopeptide/dipeptide ABC transporter ATP-binding protein
VIFITHDLATEAEVADRLLVMYAGKLAEIGTNEQIYSKQGPIHPYTEKLLKATPRLHEKVEELSFIPGTPPDLVDPPSGCRFHPRCTEVMERCKKDEPPLIEVEPFPLRRTITQILKGEHVWVKAVDGITFNINQGEIFGLVGESGCGKTTTGKLLMKLLEPTDGKIIFKGEDVTHLKESKIKKYRRNVQMVFQDPYASMNPRFQISSPGCP